MQSLSFPRQTHHARRRTTSPRPWQVLDRHAGQPQPGRKAVPPVADRPIAHRGPEVRPHSPRRAVPSQWQLLGASSGLSDRAVDELSPPDLPRYRLHSFQACTIRWDKPGKEFQRTYSGFRPARDPIRGPRFPVTRTRSAAGPSFRRPLHLGSPSQDRIRRRPFQRP